MAIVGQSSSEFVKENFDNVGKCISFKSKLAVDIVEHALCIAIEMGIG